MLLRIHRSRLQPGTINVILIFLVGQANFRIALGPAPAIIRDSAVFERTFLADQRDPQNGSKGVRRQTRQTTTVSADPFKLASCD